MAASKVIRMRRVMPIDAGPFLELFWLLALHVYNVYRR